MSSMMVHCLQCVIKIIYIYILYIYIYIYMYVYNVICDGTLFTMCNKDYSLSTSDIKRDREFEFGPILWLVFHPLVTSGRQGMSSTRAFARFFVFVLLFEKRAYWHSQNNRRPRNSFQRLVVPVDYHLNINTLSMHSLSYCHSHNN